MINVMLDLETMGTKPNAPIIAIGAAMFNTTLGIYKTFYTNVDLVSTVDNGAVIDPNTVMWWMKQDKIAQEALLKDGVDICSALHDFSAWLNDDVSGDTRIWGNGATFDNVILSTAYGMAGINKPWKYYNDMCYRTIKNLAPSIELVRYGIHHNALDDAISQANHLLAICNHLGIRL